MTESAWRAEPPKAETSLSEEEFEHGFTFFYDRPLLRVVKSKETQACWVYLLSDESPELCETDQERQRVSEETWLVAKISAEAYGRCAAEQVINGADLFENAQQVYLCKQRFEDKTIHWEASAINYSDVPEDLKPQGDGQQ